MKQLRKMLFTVLPVLIFCFGSCTKGDLNRPTIEIVSPENSDDLKIGEPINLEIILKDDVGLMGYDIDIHWGEDHGAHSVASGSRPLMNSRSVNTNTDKRKTYQLKKSFKISGKEVVIKHKEIIIDAGCRPGKYHFGITCVDENGNSSVAWLNDLYFVE